MSEIPDLTEGQAQALEFVCAFIAERGYSPTVREVAVGLGLSIQPTHSRLLSLKNKGVITWEPSMSRTIRVLL